jgi:hypothetical protein
MNHPSAKLEDSSMRRAHPPSLALALPLLAATLMTLLVGCATSSEPASELLDRDTGTTLVRMPKPVELVATVHRDNGADPFAFVAPFVTNRMGARSYFIWISSPNDNPIEGGPTLYCDGSPVTLPTPATTLTSDLSGRPYEQPVPWSADSYFEIDAAALRHLGDCRRVAIAVRYQAGGEVRFEGDAGSELLAFVTQADVG